MHSKREARHSAVWRRGDCLKVKVMLLHSPWFKEPPDNNLVTFADAITCGGSSPYAEQH